MTEHWVINASPLILLGKAGQLDWLAKLGTVAIPQSVAAEISAGSEADPARQFIVRADGGALVQADAPASDALKAWDLGAGETSVVAWAVHHKEFEAVLDDAAARVCAGVFGVRYRGNSQPRGVGQKTWLHRGVSPCV